MKTVSLILTSLTLFCEFPQNIMHKFSYKNPNMQFDGSSLSAETITVIRKPIRNNAHWGKYTFT